MGDEPITIVRQARLRPGETGAKRGGSGAAAPGGFDPKAQNHFFQRNQAKGATVVISIRTRA